jgi:predicted transcriptional regulator
MRLRFMKRHRSLGCENLRLFGCSEARVAVIVNMSPAMVHHYSKKVSQFRLAARGDEAIRGRLGKYRLDFMRT